MFMDYFEPLRDGQQIVKTNKLHFRAIEGACGEFFYEWHPDLGEFNEDHLLEMIFHIYADPITSYIHILPDEETAEKTLEEAKISLSRKLEKKSQVKKKEKIRKRILIFLSLIENPKYDEHKPLLSEIVRTFDEEYFV